MSSNANVGRDNGGSEGNAETNNSVQEDPLPLDVLRDDSAASGVASGPNNEVSTIGNNNNSNRNEIPSNFFRLNPEELSNGLQARDVLEDLSSRVLARAARALQRSRALLSPSASEAVAASEAASFSPSNSSSSQENSLDQHQQERLGRALERISERISRNRRERSVELTERLRERRSRRRRRSRDSSSENEESSSRRRRRAQNVVESLRELMVVPTSSTLGDNTEGGTPRSDADADISTDNANAGEDPNQSLANNNAQEAEPSNQPTQEESNTSSINRGEGADSGLRNVFRRGEEERNDAQASNDRRAEGNDEENDSDEEPVNIDNILGARIQFEVDSIIDRQQILNNLMQRSIRMLRDVEGGALAAQRSTDLKCPVCNEVFEDYQASDHPNAPGNRAGSTRCSHGALTLFTKLHQCPICFDDDIEPPNVVALACGHVVCKEDFCKLGGHVGTERPAGCPKPKPVPGRMETNGDSDNEEDDQDTTTSRTRQFPSIEHVPFIPFPSI